MAGVLQHTGIVVSDEQRAEGAARRARLGPSTDDELLLLDELQLPPVPRPLAGVIHRLAVFRDQAFPSPFDRLLMKRAAVVVDEIASPQDRRSRVPEHAVQP